MRSELLQTLRASRSGAAALEFAIVSVPFIGLLLGTMSVALNFYLQFAMDYSLQQAVRQVQLGLVPATTTAADFTAKVFCPVFVAFAACNNGLLISIQPVADYTAASVTAAAPPTAFCIGQPGQLMYARAIYQAPALEAIYTTAALSSGPGTSGNTIVSAAAFANENPSGSSPAGGSGC